MFNLEQSISEWRRQMAAGLRDGEALDELENHLREEIARQTKSGTEPRAAFESAVARIGNVAQLKSEFENARAPRHWWQTNLIVSKELERKMTVFLMLAMGLFIGGGMSYLILFKRGSCADLTRSQQAWALAAALMLGTLVAFGKYLHPFLPALTNSRSRGTVIVTLSLLVVAEFLVLFYGFLPRTNMTMSQLIVTLLWAMVPWGASVGIVTGLHEASHRALQKEPYV